MVVDQKKTKGKGGSVKNYIAWQGTKGVLGKRIFCVILLVLGRASENGTR